MKRNHILKGNSPLSINRELVVNIGNKYKENGRSSVSPAWSCAVATTCPGCVEPSLEPMPPYCWK